MLKPLAMCRAMLMGSSTDVSPALRFLRMRIVLEELLDSNFMPPVVCDVLYSVRRKKEVPFAAVTFPLPSAFGGRMSARSAALSGGG
jgi:hypothetical protein